MINIFTLTTNWNVYNTLVNDFIQTSKRIPLFAILVQSRLIAIVLLSMDHMTESWFTLDITHLCKT